MTIADDWLFRTRTSTLALIVAWIVLAIGVGVWIGVTKDLRLVANTVNLFSAAVTFFGLVYAYARASSDVGAWLLRQRARLQRLRAWITGRPLPVPKGQAVGTFRFDSYAAGHVTVHLDQSRDIPEQLAQLTGFVNRLSAALTRAEVSIYELGRAIEQAKAETREGDAQTLAAAATALRRFADQLSRSQVLDLRYAIAGVGFSIVGAALNFYT